MKKIALIGWILTIVVILLVVGVSYLWFITGGPGGPKIQYDEYCYPEHPKRCNRECVSNDDCKMTNCFYDFAVNKNQKIGKECDPEREQCPLCGVFEAKCINNICEKV